MKKLILTAVAGAFICTTAAAEDWYIYANTDKAWYFFNLDEFECSGNICQAWDAGVYTNKFYDLQLSRIVVDCHEGKTKSLGEFRYRNGKIDSQQTRESPWLYPPPNTIGREMIVTICNPRSRNPDNFVNFKSFMESIPNIQKAIRHYAQQKQ